MVNKVMRIGVDEESVPHGGDEDIGGGLASEFLVHPISFDRVLSTGCTLLDLAISGGRHRGGGIPGGIFVEAYGPDGSGKTALLAEICRSAFVSGGDAQFGDPEGRFDASFRHRFDLTKHFNDRNYYRPNTVTEMFNRVGTWEPQCDGIAVDAVDSLAALSTNLEMDEEEGDKMGMRRAKEFSEGFRKYGRLLAQPNRLLVASNQLRESPQGHTVTPGGRALRYYASLRLELKRPLQNWKIERTRKWEGKDIKKVVGVVSEVQIVKSSIDEPFRRARLYIVGTYGIDDVRGNLQFLKDMTQDKVYGLPGAAANSMDLAIQKVEDSDRVDELREKVIDLWGEVEEQFTVDRKPKVRR